MSGSTYTGGLWPSLGRSGWSLWLVGLALLWPNLTPGAHVAMKLDQVVNLSDTIVHGQVVGTSAQWVQDERGRHIYTYATVQCFAYLKGTGASRIEVEWPGGTVGEIQEELSEAQPLAAGEEVFLFLDKHSRPAAGLYSKSLVVNGLALGLEQALPADQLQERVGRLTGRRAPEPVIETQGLGNGAAQLIHAKGPVSIRRLPVGTAASGAPAPAGQSGPSPAEAMLYDNSTFPPGGLYYAPGPGYEILDYGTTSGGKVTQFRIAYVTSLADPGDILVAFYSGTSSGTRGTRLIGFDISGLDGSPDGSLYLFDATFTLEAANQFTLPAGAFGYSYQFVNSITGVPLAAGGAGNVDGFWQNYSLANFGGSVEASFYMQVWSSGIVGNTPVITGITPSSASAGTSNNVTITGSHFGASQGSSVVEFFYQSGQPKITAPVSSWSDTSITCQVPVDTVNGYPGSAASGPVTVTTSAGTSAGYNFIVTFGYGLTRWPNPQVHYRVNENTADCVGEASALQSAAAQWNNAGANFAFLYDGSTTATTSSGNGVNELLWGSCPPGVIAYASKWINSITRETVECDIVFNDPDYVWIASGVPTGGQMDIQTTAVHELGHWLCLRDLYGNIGDGLNDNGKIMYGFGSNGQVKRTLAAADRAGIQWIYGVPAGNLAISRSGNTVTLRWSNGVLQQADSLQGPYSDLTGASSPYSTAAAGTRKFYRLRY